MPFPFIAYDILRIPENKPQNAVSPAVIKSLHSLSKLGILLHPPESAGSDRHPFGGRQSHPARHHRPGESSGGANLPDPVEDA